MSIILRAVYITLRFALSIILADKYDNYFRLNNYIDIYIYNDLSRFINYKLLYNKRIQFSNIDTHI